MTSKALQDLNTRAQKRWPGRWTLDPVGCTWSEDRPWPHSQVPVRASVGILWMEMSLGAEKPENSLLTRRKK